MTDALSVVRQFGVALHEGDLDGACRYLHEDLLVREAGGLPYSGEYVGPQGFRALLNEINQHLELRAGPMTQDPLPTDSVISRFEATFISLNSGESVVLRLVEIYRVRDGQIVELDVYYKDPSAVSALLSPSTP